MDIIAPASMVGRHWPWTRPAGNLAIGVWAIVIGVVALNGSSLHRLTESSQSPVRVDVTGSLVDARQTMGELNHAIASFIFTATFWLEKLVLELAIPALIIGGILLMFGRRVGWRVLWGTGLAVFIALFAKPVIEDLPHIFSSIMWPF